METNTMTKDLYTLNQDQRDYLVNRITKDLEDIENKNSLIVRKLKQMLYLLSNPIDIEDTYMCHPDPNCLDY